MTDIFSVLIYPIQLLLQWPECLGRSQLEPQELLGGCFTLLEEPWNKEAVTNQSLDLALCSVIWTLCSPGSLGRLVCFAELL